MNTEQNKALARRWIEAFEKGDKAALESLCEPNVVDRTAVPGLPDGLAGIKIQNDMYVTAFPDIRFTTQNVVAEGDQVAISWVAGGTHTGPLQGLPPTGRTVSVVGCNIFTIAQGQIAEQWVFFDRLTLMMQLGAIPAPQA